MQLAFTFSKLKIENLTMCEICTKLAIKHQSHVTDVFLVSLFEQISHIVVLPLSTLNKRNAGSVFEYYFLLGRCSVIGGGGGNKNKFV